MQAQANDERLWKRLNEVQRAQRQRRSASYDALRAAREATYAARRSEAEQAARLAAQERSSRHHNKRRARKAAVPHEPYSRQEVFDRDNGCCYLCEIPLEPGWHVEHVVPIAMGGPDTFDNVRAACPPCNLRKGVSVPWAYSS